MRDIINTKLEEIERREEVRILYACESGSRAWGMASRNSDWDVRFLYVHPQAWYLAVDIVHKQDVIERPLEDDLDINGWDLRKALGLFWKSNPSLLEWLDSPMIYLEQGKCAERLRALRAQYFSPRASWYHYLHMAQGNYREFLRGETVWIKKYLYVLRPLLVVRWLERELGPVPVLIQTLVDHVVNEGEIKEALEKLLEAKKTGDELGRRARVPILSEFIEHEFHRHGALSGPADHDKPPVEPLNALFREILAEQV